MWYMHAKWVHSYDDEPVDLYSEVDDGWEVRKVEIYADGSAQYAGPEGATGDTLLSEARLLTLDEINRDPQFKAVSVSQREFERVWQVAHGAS